MMNETQTLTRCIELDHELLPEIEVSIEVGEAGVTETSVVADRIAGAVREEIENTGPEEWHGDDTSDGPSAWLRRA